MFPLFHVKYMFRVSNLLILPVLTDQQCKHLWVNRHPTVALKALLKTVFSAVLQSHARPTPRAKEEDADLYVPCFNLARVAHCADLTSSQANVYAT